MPHHHASADPRMRGRSDVGDARTAAPSASARWARPRRIAAHALVVGWAGVLTACSADAGAPPAPTAGDSRVSVPATASPTQGDERASAGSEGDSGQHAGVEAGADGAQPGAVDAGLVEHADRRYLVVTLPLDAWEVRVDWEPGGTMLADVIAEDPRIAVATNAGIFTPEVAPGGLLVSDGEERVGLNLAEGAGNFHLMPNGVFSIRADGTATVEESTAYEPSGVVHATQSGPALVLDGEIHPAFNEGSTNLLLRSGVGVTPDGETVVLAMSWGVTSFWDFATLFRDALGVDDALYLDGQISELWVDGMEPPGPLAGPYAGVITARPLS